ncbi:unnamed protein product [Oikopleura dioica]|uniref:Protein Hikeshi n=1 Tax=Oikopleura dioica TaxID=34765 RepID=E4XIG3_OIKDI|nr:unnamed protein product [Oikopleura dioica]
MFGCILAGQPVQTEFERVSETDFVLRLNQLEPSFLTVFLTGQELLPEGAAVSIYISIPSDGEDQWHFLGFISNEKQSGTFKITNLKRIAAQGGTGGNGNQFGNFRGPQVGLSLKPLAEVAGFTPAVSTDTSTLVTRIAESIYNYCTSFVTGDGGSVPLATIEAWFRNTQQRLERNPNHFR